MKILVDDINKYSDIEYSHFYDNLNKTDKIKIDHLIKKDDKKRSILGRYLLSKLLKDNYNLDYNKIDILYTPNGKPYTNDVFFSVSHANDYVVVAISKQRIGIDIALIKKVNQTLINQFCSLPEKEYLSKTNNLPENIFTLFCLKEAYLKMIDSSILNATQIIFNIEDNNITCLNNSNINISIDKQIKNYIIAIIEEKSD